MAEEELKEFVEKRVFVVLKNDYHYVGKVLSLGNEFLKIRDKLDKIVFIKISEIKTIAEEKL